MKTAGKYIFFLSVFAFLGFSREFLFVNMNAQLYKLYYQNPDIKIPDSLAFMASYSYETLYYAKYPLTVLYFLAYFLMSWWASKSLSKNKHIGKWIIYIYSLLLILAGIAMVYNYLFNNQLDGDAYTFSRWLMGIAQSPLVAFFTIASASLYDKINKNTNYISTL